MYYYEKEINIHISIIIQFNFMYIFLFGNLSNNPQQQQKETKMNLISNIYISLHECME